MTATDKAARRKLSLLELAKHLDSVSKACKLMRYSRQQLYEIRRNFHRRTAAAGQGQTRTYRWNTER